MDRSNPIKNINPTADQREKEAKRNNNDKKKKRKLPKKTNIIIIIIVIMIIIQYTYRQSGRVIRIRAHESNRKKQHTKQKTKKEKKIEKENPFFLHFSQWSPCLPRED